MNCKKLFKNLLSIFCSPILYILIAYILLFIGFIVIIKQSEKVSESEWVTENFSITPEPQPKECHAIHGFYSKLLREKQSLGKEFEKVINQNLWNLYES